MQNVKSHSSWQHLCHTITWRVLLLDLSPIGTRVQFSVYFNRRDAFMPQVLWSFELQWEGGTYALHKHLEHSWFLCMYSPSPQGNRAKCTQLTSLVPDEISICCSWWTSEPNKASRKQPHRNTILDIHQSEQHVSCISLSTYPYDGCSCLRE
jgi:hypothetical protein